MRYSCTILWIAVVGISWVFFGGRLVCNGRSGGRLHRRPIGGRLAGWNRHIDSIADAADQAAQGLAAGGTVYLAGEPGMVAELLGRAGGLCGAKAIAPRSTVAEVPDRRRGFVQRLRSA